MNTGFSPDYFMLVYRIAKTKHITDLNGTGAKLFGGRWNEKGTPLVYTSSSISLAILESLVHFPLHLAPGDMSLSFINIPDALIENSIELNSLGKIPKSWREYPPTIETQRFTKKWITEKKSLILKVPSAINSAENNYLINQVHKDFNLITIDSTSIFSFNIRLF